MKVFDIHFIDLAGNGFSRFVQAKTEKQALEFAKKTNKTNPNEFLSVDYIEEIDKDGIEQLKEMGWIEKNGFECRGREKK